LIGTLNARKITRISSRSASCGVPGRGPLCGPAVLRISGMLRTPFILLSGLIALPMISAAVVLWLALTQPFLGLHLAPQEGAAVVAGRLDDEQIAALAAYYEQIGE